MLNSIFVEGAINESGDHLGYEGGLFCSDWMFPAIIFNF